MLINSNVCQQKCIGIMSNDLNTIIQKIIQFREERDWRKYHDPKNLSQAIGIEAAELQEIFLWKRTDESKDLSQKEMEHLREETADIFIYLMYLCHEFNFDILDAVEKKIKKNAVKYPVSKSKGTSRKYTEFKEKQMKREYLTYEQAKIRHADCYIDLKYMEIDESYPDYETIPVGFVPAILVWKDKASALKDDNGSACIEVYWLKDED